MSFRFEKYSTGSGEIDNPGSLKSLYVSYHGLIKSTMKLNVSVEKQKYFQNVGGIVEFCSFPA